VVLVIYLIFGCFLSHRTKGGKNMKTTLEEYKDLEQKIREASSLVFSGTGNVNVFDKQFVEDIKRPDNIANAFLFWLEQVGNGELEFMKEYAEDVFSICNEDASKKLVYLRETLEFDVEGNIRDCIVESIIDVVKQTFSYIMELKSPYVSAEDSLDMVIDCWRIDDVILSADKEHTQFFLPNDCVFTRTEKPSWNLNSGKIGRDSIVECDLFAA
jgi:hypothetical protein